MKHPTRLALPALLALALSAGAQTGSLSQSYDRPSGPLPDGTTMCFSVDVAVEGTTATKYLKTVKSSGGDGDTSGSLSVYETNSPEAVRVADSPSPDLVGTWTWDGDSQREDWTIALSESGAEVYQWIGNLQEINGIGVTQPRSFVVKKLFAGEHHGTNAVCVDYALYAGETTLTSGWWVVAGNVTNDTRIEVDGDVHLILCDGAVLTALHGIELQSGFSLTVYGQSGDSGTLFAGTDGTTDQRGNYKVTCLGMFAGIGVSGIGTCGTITIHGGRVTAVGGDGGGDSAAGIGGGQGGNGGDVKIFGGTVTVRGGSGSAAIGRGKGGNYDGDLTLGAMKVTEPAGTLATNRMEACRALNSTVTLEVCEPHEYEGEACKWCGAEDPRHTVAFVWHGGSSEVKYPAGTAAADVAVPDDPENYTENGTNYTFTGWSPAAVADVTTNATYTAQYGIVPELEVVSCVVDAFSGDDDEMTLVLAGPDDCDGVADVAIYEWDTTGDEPVPGGVVWSSNGVALAEGAAELTVSIDTGVVLPGQLVVATYLPNDQYAGATASNRVMGTSSISIAVESSYHVDDDIVLVLTPVNSTGGIAVTLYVPDGNGGLTEYDWDCTVEDHAVDLSWLPAGEYVVVAVLDGDDNYLGSDDTKSFRVDKIESGLEAEAGETTEGEPVTVTATLGHADCTGIVTFAVDGDEYDGVVVDGIAVVTISDLAAGDYEATVTYSGDDKYLEASTNFTFTMAAARPSEEVDGVIWYYERVDGTAVVTGIEEAHATGNLTMPETLGGLTVLAVGSEAFDHMTNITGMVLASGVKDIWNDAFCGCTGLTNVTFGTGLTTIEAGGFSYCTNLANVRLPDGLASIGSLAFCGDRSLTNVWLGTGIESVGENAFAGCTSLATIWMPIEKKGSDLLDNAGVPDGCTVRHYGTQVVTFDPNGGTCETETNAYVIGEPYGALPEATRNLHKFKGWWATNGNDAVEVTTNSVVTEEAARTLRAAWERTAVSNVVATASDPWDGKVMLTFDVENNAGAMCPAWNQPYLSIVATDNLTGSEYVSSANALSGDTSAEAGSHAVTWDLAAQGIDFFSTNVTFAVSYRKLHGYCVIDLSGGPSAASYPVSYFDAPPEGGWTDAHKTTNLVMSLVAPGAFTMGGACSEERAHNVVLTQPFYCAVFETTQKQWELVKGNNPSDGASEAPAQLAPVRPVDSVSWNMIRGDSSIYDWPDIPGVDPSSFVGLLRQKTGISSFDLPTEAQWEYACRAGTTNAYSYGDDPDGAYMWYDEITWPYVGPHEDYSHEVGTRKPNEWGLYDMHGNVWEWCLDHWAVYPATSSSCVTNPVGPTYSPSGIRIRRGGHWMSDYANCTSTFRSNPWPTFAENDTGFRLVRTLSDNPEGERGDEAAAGTVCAGASASITVGEPPSVMNVHARQRWPWNGLVDVDYEIGGYTEGLKVKIDFDEQGGLNRHWVATNFIAGAAPSAAKGRHRVTWDAAADGVTNVVAEIKATVKLAWTGSIIPAEFRKMYLTDSRKEFKIPYDADLNVKCRTDDDWIACKAENGVISVVVEENATGHMRTGIVYCEVGGFKESIDIRQCEIDKDLLGDMKLYFVDSKNERSVVDATLVASSNVTGAATYALEVKVGGSDFAIPVLLDEKTLTLSMNAGQKVGKYSDYFIYTGFYALGENDITFDESVSMSGSFQFVKRENEGLTLLEFEDNGSWGNGVTATTLVFYAFDELGKKVGVLKMFHFPYLQR